MRTATLAAIAIVFAIPNAALAQDDPLAETSFTVVLLPDTQFYAEKHPDTYVAQTLWVRARRKDDNIKFAIHLGDIVQTSTKKPEVWQKLIRKQPNIFLVVSGHVLGVGLQTSINDACETSQGCRTFQTRYD